MGGLGAFVEGAEVELREVFRPFGTWDFEGPMLHAGQRGTIEVADPAGRLLVVRFPGYRPVRVPRSILKPTGRRLPPPSPPSGPPPGL